MNDHLAAYTAPLVAQAVEIIKSVRAEAKSAKISLAKVLTMLAADRGVRGGEALDFNNEFFSGLI